MENESTIELLFELLQSGDEALDYLCENILQDATETCVLVSETLSELYENIAAYIENNNIKEQHRGREAALNAGLAAGKLRRIYSGGDLKDAAFLLTYELLPLHLFLSNELNFWFAVFPDVRKMQETRDMQLAGVTEYLSRHKETLEKEYAFDVSIMLLCYNNAHITKIAYESLLKYTNFEKYLVEIIVVNNGSNDNGETSAFIEKISDPRIKTVDLKYPLGYNGYSLGPLAAGGRYFIEFHTDVIATENWLDNLIGCISSDWRIGAVVAACNESSNHQMIPVCYNNPMENDVEMQHFAKNYNHPDPQKWEERTRIVPTSGYVIPTELYRHLLRDPWLYYGQFTDDDMSVFLRRSGFRQVFAKDTFLHHFGSQTSSREIVENDSLGQSQRRFYIKWGVDAWYSIGTNFTILVYLESRDINDSESFLFVDPLFGANSMYILNKYREKGIKVGATAAIISDQRYEADAKYCYDRVLVGNVAKKLVQLNYKYDYIIFQPCIEEYIDKDFPDLLKALLLVSKQSTKVLFTLSNPAYFQRLQDFVSGTVTSRPFEPWNGVRFVDIGYVYDTAQKQGFNCTVINVQGAQDKTQTQIIERLQTALQDSGEVDAMTVKARLFELSPK